MDTAEDILAAIAVERTQRTRLEQEEVAAVALKTQAIERQRLRRELEELRNETSFISGRITSTNSYTRMVDADELGPFLSLTSSAREESRPLDDHSGPELSHASCNQDVIKTEHVWTIEGMSWLTHALASSSDDFACSNHLICAGRDEFELVYHPQRDFITYVGSVEGAYASLALRCVEETTSTFRYRFLIRRNDGEFVQWGSQGEELCADDKMTSLYGPDVQYNNGPAGGIFGLTHEGLLQSEWVKDDTLTVKCQIEVRPGTLDENELPAKRAKVEVPPSSPSSILLAMLEAGKLADVTFNVKGGTLKAHSQVLASRCEVFEKEFSCGMCESVSKEISVEDTDLDVFKAFLQFLYSDDLTHTATCMEKYAVQASSSTQGSDGARSSTESPEPSKATFLQDLLSVSHKYQVTRLCLWCQQQLCDRISEDTVCPVLWQAHLCEAKALEETCLAYIKANMKKVVLTPSFAHLSSQWPALLLKISVFESGMSSDDVEAALVAQQESLRKRKREDD
eukprot:TRINITY_DN9212_c0_g4_i1.p1 TRINITY_DN9212_c0_g4~~TRINITY_DN9212_c0_g4_i1.p1  ORF type:complete len:522 (-),score=63.41 TRINITY_DN9212_c0_g4_i1:34-1569(-)